MPLHADRALAPRAGLPRLPRRRRRATPGPTLPDRPQGAVHRPLAARAGAGRRPLPRPAARRAPPPSPSGSGCSPWADWALGLAERRAHARAVAGPRHPRGHPRPRRHRPHRGRAGRAPRASPPTTSRCSTTSTSRPPAWPRGRPGLRPHPVAQRRPRGDGRAGRPGRRPRPGRRVRADVDDRGGPRRRGRGRHHRAHRRVHAGHPPPRASRVTVLEASARVGGKILTTPFAGRPVDCAADAFLARVPEARDLCDELGLGGTLTAPAAPVGAGVGPGRAATACPTGLVLGVPDRPRGPGRLGHREPRRGGPRRRDLEATEVPGRRADRRPGGRRRPVGGPPGARPPRRRGLRAARRPAPVGGQRRRRRPAQRRHRRRPARRRRPTQPQPHPRAARPAAGRARCRRRPLRARLPRHPRRHPGPHRPPPGPAHRGGRPRPPVLPGRVHRARCPAATRCAPRGVASTRTGSCSAPRRRWPPVSSLRPRTRRRRRAGRARVRLGRHGHPRRAP